MQHLTLLCAFAFCAGMIDAVVVGLIQIPAPINVFPGTQAATIFGTRIGMKRGTPAIRAWFLFLPVSLILKLACGIVKPA